MSSVDGKTVDTVTIAQGHSGMSASHNLTTIDAMSVSHITSAMTSLDLRNPPTLLGLPLELRQVVYRFIFDPEKIHGTIHVLNRSKKGKILGNKLPVPSVMLVCRQIRAEALPIYWENRQVWLNSVTYQLNRKPRTALFQVVPLLSDGIRINIRHIRGQCLEKWGSMNRGRARYLLQRFPNLKSFRFHGASLVGPFWAEGISEYPTVMESALRACGGNFKSVNTKDIISSFPMNPKGCRIEFQMVIVVTVVVPDDYDYYLLYINLNTGRHMFVEGTVDIDHLTLGPRDDCDDDDDKDIWSELRR
ncbi:hypothetical protein GGR57DRAFT_516178 [Xylariaceae sp. FL1272]|nr:hypothetical protein GGR57DRAFT_516178 [Xylariaceae sp. FL1272]